MCYVRSRSLKSKRNSTRNARTSKSSHRAPSWLNPQAPHPPPASHPRKRNETKNIISNGETKTSRKFFGSCNIFNLIGSFGASIMSLQQHFWLNFMIMAMLLLLLLLLPTRQYRLPSLSTSASSSPIKIFPV